MRSAHGLEAALAVVAGQADELPGSEPWRGEVLRRAAALQASLRAGDEEEAVRAAMTLAGLGEGSTPAGDDYLVGLLHALPLRGGASTLITAIGDVGAGRTTAASSAWLAAAARGEASPVWRSLLDALAAGDPAAVAAAARAVRATGHTSGAFSLRGFLDTVSS